MNLKTGTVEGEADMKTVSCAFFLLCLILGGVDVENERVEWMWKISEEDIYLRLQKQYFCVVLMIM